MVLRGCPRFPLPMVITMMITIMCFNYLNPLRGLVSQGHISNSDEYIPNYINETDPKRPPSIPRTFPIEEEDFCVKRAGLDYITYIYSALSHVAARNDTRMTWANSKTSAKLGVKLAAVFIVGRPKNEEEALILKSESELYHDIIQGDFADSYELLVYKGLAGMEWVNRHCNHVPWAVHTDDDVMVDIVLLDQALKKRAADSKDEFICYEMRNIPIMRSGKWAVSAKSYPEKFYPDYCSGTFWIVQTRNLQRLLNASQYVNFIWIDDAYQTGFLRKEVGNIGHSWFPKYNIYLFEPFQKSHVGNTIVWYEQRGKHRENWRNVLEYYRWKFNMPNLLV